MKTILVINPGSTSTKLSIYHNDQEYQTIDIFHDSSVLKQFKTINDQLPYRMEVVYSFLNENNVQKLDAIACRGGASYALEGGTYEVDELLINDTKACKGGLYHSSMLGVQMGKEVQKLFGGKMYMSDPTVVDEYSDIARISGIDGIYRKSICHALNQKAVAKKYAKDINRKYEELNLIVAHIDGGITIMAHQLGKMIDGNDGGGGEGPFTPTRMGNMAISDVINYLWDKPKEEMLNLCSCTGGLSNYFNTSNADIIHLKKDHNDPKASLVWDAMIYQVCKAIGAMSCVLNGKVDGIVLTGGLLRFDDVSEQIKQRCGWIAPIAIYQGEYEQQALATNAYEALTGKIEVKKYTGKPIWEGFK